MKTKCDVKKTLSRRYATGLKFNSHLRHKRCCVVR